MRLTTPLLGAALGGVFAMSKGSDPWKYVVWGGGLGLLVTILGGASASVGGLGFRVGAAVGPTFNKHPRGGPKDRRGVPGYQAALPGYGGYDGSGPYSYGDDGTGGYSGEGGPYEGGYDTYNW